MIAQRNRHFSFNSMRGAYLRHTCLAVAVGSALVLSGCAKSRMTTGSIPVSTINGKSVDAMNPQELGSAINHLGARYSKAPSDKNLGIAYATALRTDGRNDQSLAVMRRLAISHPDDRDVLSAYGKALASSGQFEAALESIRRAQTPEYPDWKLLSAEGAILDQIGQSEAARKAYRRALQIQPGEPSILSNMGMSHLLTGELGHAETYLKQAMNLPGSDSRVRQNLALVVGLQGRFDEAMQIAGAELSPDQAKANVAYLKDMLAQQNSWKELEGKKSKKS